MINVGTKEEYHFENFVCFIYGGAGSLLRLRPKSTGSGSASLHLVPLFRIVEEKFDEDPDPEFVLVIWILSI